MIQQNEQNQQVKIIPPPENKTSNSSRSAKNWMKVRQMMKKISKNQLIQIKSRYPNTLTQNNCKLIAKIQRKLSLQQKEHFIQDLRKSSQFNLNLVQNSQILQIINNFIYLKDTIQDFSNFVLTTYRPVPKINYLAHQKIGQNMIDTTGAWVWQAQEILSYYLLKNWSLYTVNQNMKVLQIGAGCSGLAALTYSKTYQLYIQKLYKTKNNNLQKEDKTPNTIIEQKSKKILQVIITDGKKQNIVFLHKNIQNNFNKSTYLQIKSQKYIWGEETCDQANNIFNKKFQLILAADCLFFQQYHNQLIQTLVQFLAIDNGVAIFVNPRRGNSLSNFLSKIQHINQKLKQCELIYKFIDFDDLKYKEIMQKAKNKQNYIADKDEFVFIEIKKKCKNNINII